MLVVQETKKIAMKTSDRRENDSVIEYRAIAIECRAIIFAAEQARCATITFASLNPSVHSVPLKQLVKSRQQAQQLCTACPFSPLIILVYASFEANVWCGFIVRNAAAFGGFLKVCA
jgi:hypothetical protein